MPLRIYHFVLLLLSCYSFSLLAQESAPGTLINSEPLYHSKPQVKDIEEPVRRRCGKDQIMAALEKNDPDFKTKRALIEKQMQDWIKQNSHKKAKQVLSIPTVVHVLNKNNTDTISDAQIHEQIAILNEDFRRLNPDTSNTPLQFVGVAADCEIEFCLANLDPNGNPTTGITRRQTNGVDETTFYSTSQGGQDIWDPGSYLNIYVFGTFALGFTQFPGGPTYSDAICISPRCFGNTDDPQYNLGRTATHEVGHWLNLEHVWGSNFGAGCNSDDLVSDTPLQSIFSGFCPTSQVSCGSDDMYMNYMDYVDDYCMNIFTLGQKERMWATINTQRSSLLHSQGCAGISTLDAEFTVNSTNINVGGSVNFTDQSTGSPNSWSWDFGNGLTSIQQNPSNVTYNMAGTYTVFVTVSDGSSSDIETKAGYIIVTGPTTGIPEPSAKDKKLLTITDILGRTTHLTPNTLLFYIYDDGSVEKRIQQER